MALPLAAQAGSAQVAAYALEILLVQGVVLQVLHPDVAPHVRRAPVADGVEHGLVGDEGVPFHETDVDRAKDSNARLPSMVTVPSG